MKKAIPIITIIVFAGLVVFPNPAFATGYFLQISIRVSIVQQFVP